MNKRQVEPTRLEALMAHRLELSEYHEDPVSELKPSPLIRNAAQQPVFIPQRLYNEFERLAQVQGTTIDFILFRFISIGLIALLEKECEPDTQILIHNSQRDHRFPLE